MSRHSWGGRRAARLVTLTLATYGNTCHICGRPGATSADHIIPRSLGGDDSLDNLRPAHLSCNASRGNRPINRPPKTRDGLAFFKPAGPVTPRLTPKISPEPDPKPAQTPPQTTEPPHIVTLDT